jgi:hypothetical protein
MDSPILEFGKYKGKSLSDILTSDKEYCQWIVISLYTCNKPFTQTPKFVEYVRWLEKQGVIMNGNHATYAMMRYFKGKDED